MPLTEPPDDAPLRALPGAGLAGTVLHRVYRRPRTEPWFFASLPAGRTTDGSGGRFDLPAPDGTCYTATSVAGAVLETFQGFGSGVLPIGELHARVRAIATAPPSAPRAAVLTAKVARGAGVTQALWASQDRCRTQAWAAALHRAGWQALRHGVQHDPTGRLRAVTLFDRAGQHAPYGDAASWTYVSRALHDDPEVLACLAAHAITVVPEPHPTIVSLEDSGLLP